MTLPRLRSLFSGLRPTEEPKRIELALGGEIIGIQLRRSARVKRFVLKISGATGEIVLSVPQKATLKQARDFVETHRDWLQERRARLPERKPFAPGETILLRGVEHVLDHRPTSRRPGWVEEGAPPKICIGGAAEHFERRTRDFLRAEARRDLEAAVARHAHNIGKQPTSLNLRDGVSRWGSCSAQGALNFSWRLIFAPPFVLDYLAAHETAHLRHHNHSADFWLLTERLCPRTKEAEAWLKRHGASLHRFGREAV